jgi:hypothetical protein
MALYYLVMWLAAIFLCVLAGFRGWLHVRSLSIPSFLTDIPRQNDRSKKRARQLCHLPKRFYISLARKLHVWMHIALCVVGFLSFTVLIWLILIYSFVRPSPCNGWHASDLTLPDHAASGSCCTILLRPILLSTSLQYAAAQMSTQRSSKHITMFVFLLSKGL